MSTVIINDFVGKSQAPDLQFDSYFYDYTVKELNDCCIEDKNFLYLYYRPEDFYQIICSQSKEFYKQVREKKCNVLIYHEGFDLFRVPEIFEKNIEIDNVEYWKIVCFFRSHGIEEDRLYFVTAATGYQEDLKLLEYKIIKYIGDIRPVRANFCHLNPMLVWGSNHKEFIARDKFFEKTYASLSNGRPSVHRYEFTKKLWQQDLINDGLVSMCHMSMGNKEFESHLPMVYDYQHNKSWRKHTAENYIFDKIFLWVSNETHMDNKLTLFSEKTIRPILYMNPFVINGDVGTLAHLQDLGFKTFGDFWDESYDLTENIDERQKKIINIIKGLKNKNLQMLYSQMQSTLEHNRNLLINKNWLDPLHKFLQS